MTNLDDTNKMRSLDPSAVLKSTEMYAEQCRQAWKEASAIVFPNEYKQAKNAVVCGMGGSRFTPLTIKELYRDKIKIPYEIVEDYTLPAYVNQESLVILSSYSGTTEEVVACGKQAFSRKAKVTAVAKGGKVAQMLESNSLPFYKFDPKHNPSNQPRIGGGYMIMGHLGLLRALKLIDVNAIEVTKAISYAQKVGKKYAPKISVEQNRAKQLARLLFDTHPFIITAEHLKGFGNGFANQINETAKLISDYRYISELNHHLMEGLKRPSTLHQTGFFVFFLSNLYSPRIQKRFVITLDVVKKQEVKTHEVWLQGTSKLSQVLEAFVLSGFTTFYLAMLYDTDPVAIPWVDYFKEKLGQPLE